jgi:hypothetical protein
MQEVLGSSRARTPLRPFSSSILTDRPCHDTSRDRSGPPAHNSLPQYGAGPRSVQRHAEIEPCLFLRRRYN